ncbi:MAG: nuclear transport factor 2 family protein [Candidatus Kapaibacterium sp.]|nr:MAG: nuclear transport factor 2 family protein [Candidatus Kapabacteria bacterium]
MHQNAELLTKLYTSFQNLDAATMGECYHPEATFTDEAFTNLNYKQTLAMWAMLCSRARNFNMLFSDVVANDTSGKAHWEPTYTFTSTGRLVHNIIDSEFEFKDGKIIRQRDYFDFYRWSRQALGTAGILLGWTPILRNKVQTEAMKGLAQYMNKHTL